MHLIFVAFVHMKHPKITINTMQITNYNFVMYTFFGINTTRSRMLFQVNLWPLLGAV